MFPDMERAVYEHEILAPEPVKGPPTSILGANAAEAQRVAKSAIPISGSHEHHVSNTIPCVREVCIHDYQPMDGYLEVPDLPGFGQDLNPEILAKSRITRI